MYARVARYFRRKAQLGRREGTHHVMLESAALFMLIGIRSLLVILENYNEIHYSYTTSARLAYMRIYTST